MSDLTYITGVVKTAEDITGVGGCVGFEVEYGTPPNITFYRYDRKLNPLNAVTSVLLETDDPFYDYIVEASGGLMVKSAWITSEQIEVFWDQVPVDTKVEVSEGTGTWLKYHFASYDINSPDGKYFYVWDEGKTSYTANNAKEFFEVTFPIWNGLGGTYFLLYSPTTSYYAWFDLDNTSTDPALANHTGIEIDIVTGDTGANIATKAKAVIDALGDFLVGAIDPAAPDKIYIRVEVEGKNYDASAGTSTVIISTTTQGGDTINFLYARLI